MATELFCNKQQEAERRTAIHYRCLGTFGNISANHLVTLKDLEAAYQC